MVIFFSSALSRSDDRVHTYDFEQIKKFRQNSTFAVCSFRYSVFHQSKRSQKSDVNTSPVCLFFRVFQRLEKYVIEK